MRRLHGFFGRGCPDAARGVARVAALLAVVALLFAAGASAAGATRGSAAGTANAAAATPLDRYLDGLTSLDTAFSQQVVDARGQQTDAGSGTLLVRRPGRFRWTYQPQDAAAGSAQVLVADGRNLWFYDPELAQVTVKPLQQALSSTPMMLLSGSRADLRSNFDITAAPPGDGLEWVDVRARDDSADFSLARLGFKGSELARMIVSDRLGQTVTLNFHGGRRNGAIDAAQLQFTPPPGADVIGKPQ